MLEVIICEVIMTLQKIWLGYESVAGMDTDRIKQSYRSPNHSLTSDKFSLTSLLIHVLLFQCNHCTVLLHVTISEK